eukprot:jgi/Picsp_1/4760/NSC_02128-R1_---NA---
MELTVGMNMQSVGGGALNEVCSSNLMVGMADETRRMGPGDPSFFIGQQQQQQQSGGVWGTWVWTAGGTRRQGWPVVAGNAGISAIGSEFNVASLDGFVDVNKYVGFEMNSSKTKDGVSVVSAIDGAFYSRSKEGKRNKDAGSVVTKKDIVASEASKRHRKKRHTAPSHGPVCVRCEVSSSLSPGRLVEEVGTTVSQNVWGTRRNSLSYLHLRGESKQIVTLCAFGTRGKRSPQQSDEQQSSAGLLGATSSINHNQNDDDDDHYSSTAGMTSNKENNRKNNKASLKTYVPHVQMNMTPVQGAWRVRDVMWGQAIGNGCTIKCHSKGCGSNIGISTALKIGNTQSSIQHDIMWRAPGQNYEDGRQHVLSKISGTVNLVFPKSTMRKYQKTLSTKICWSLGNIVDCTFSYTEPKSIKISVSVSKSPQKQPALQFGIQNG